MDNSRGQKSQQQSSQVKVDKLTQPQRELPANEAENVKGGGGVPGGVVGNIVQRQTGEEIPQ